MASPTFLGDGHTPRRTDAKWTILQKILGSEIDGGGSGGAGHQEVFIARAPAPPDDPTKPALDFPSGGGAIQQWDVGSQSWV